ncbi:MAG: ACP S-malonyltransferase [Actinomycetota bacterium]
MIAWMLPGQGSQRAGMAASLEACGDLFEQAESILGRDLARLCTSPAVTSWPADLLQPVLYTTCVGAARALLARGQRPDAVVGHSLGEFAALTAADALSFEDGLRLVHARGRAMAAAGRRNPGAMAAVLGLAADRIEEICERIEGVWVANYNSPKQSVISGTDAGLAEAAEECRQAGAVRVIRLQVPVAGHSPLMEPALGELVAAIEKAELRSPTCRFYSVIDGATHTDPNEIAKLLATALVRPVRFADALRAMAGDGVGRFIEVGPGNVLVGLARQSLSHVDLALVTSDAEADAVAHQAQDVASSNGKPSDRFRFDVEVEARAGGSA